MFSAQEEKKLHGAATSLQLVQMTKVSCWHPHDEGLTRPHVSSFVIDLGSWDEKQRRQHHSSGPKQDSLACSTGSGALPIGESRFFPSPFLWPPEWPPPGRRRLRIVTRPIADHS